MSYQIGLNDYFEILIVTTGAFGLPRIGVIEITELGEREQITVFTTRICLKGTLNRQGVYDVVFVDTAGRRERLFQLFAVGASEEG